MNTIETTSERLNLSTESFNRFARFITSELGIKMSEAKIPMLQSRLMKRLRHLQIGTLEEYREYLFSSPNAETERVQFIDAVTTNKTDFFREPQHFEYLSKTVLPAFRRSAASRFRLWCAGCSSGEEPYTQAMVLSEYACQNPGFDFDIFATDISTRVLHHAEQGIYDEARIEPIPIDLRHRYLMRSKDPTRGQVRIIPALRNRVTFQRLNFMDQNYGVREMFDVIFFRNVMIYFDRPTQEAVINKLCRNLKRGGYIFAGHSESLAGLQIPVVQVASAVFRKVT